MKQKILLLGAFDRYNYGDNLLPILFKMYLETYAPDLLNRYTLQCCAITRSDLSRFGAMPTTSLGSEDLNSNVHSIITMGGEVLAATSSVLILHNSPSVLISSSVRFMQSHRMKRVADLLCRRLLRLPWEYPYIPKKTGAYTRIALNTIGGKLPADVSVRHSLTERLAGADYVSARDRRTFDSIQAATTAKIYPDSAVTMGSLITDLDLSHRVGEKTKAQLGRKYFCFQAAPTKAGCTPYECAQILREAVKRSGCELLLLPIGYASGHDDERFLTAVHSELASEATLLPNLNIWEIMSLIKGSQAFVGTSLHGCITAMSFGVPHIGVNPRITKLQAFLQDWAISPFNRCFAMRDVADVLSMAINMDRKGLSEHARKLQAMGLENYNELLCSLELLSEGNS